MLYASLFEHYLNWLRHHERLLIIVVSSVFLSFSGIRLINYLEHRDQKIYDKDLAVLQAQVDKNTAIAQQNAALAQQYAALAQQVLAENTKLEQAIASRDVATRVQQSKDQALPPSDLSVRWELLVGLPLGSVRPATGDLFTVTDFGARQTVSALEEVPRLQSDLNDVRAEAANKDRQIAALDNVAIGLHTQVDGLGKQIVDQTVACKAEVTLVKAKVRKSKLRYFGAGYIAGLLTRPFAKALGF